MSESSTSSAAIAHRRRAIGMLYVDLGLVSRSQLNQALVECARHGVPLPTAMRRLGYLP